MRILIASSVCPDALELLREQHDVVCAVNATDEELCRRIENREVVVFRSGVNITAEVMASAPDLKLLIRAGSGLDNLDVEYAHDRALKLIRIPEPGAQAVAELTFGLMLTLARQIRVADQFLRRGHWAKHEVTGYLLHKKVLGIIGAGNIGSRVGRMGTAWGMNVIGCVEHPSSAVAARLHEKGVRLTNIEEVLAASDFLCIHVPLKESTRHLIDAEALTRMKPGAFLVNAARGGVVDEQALFHALTEGKLVGAGLDVHEREGEGKISRLSQLPNVVLTPHIGASTVDTQREIGRRVIKAISSFDSDVSVETVAEHAATQ